MILVCGESLMDMLPTEADDGQPAHIAQPGGSPFNVALALGRQEVPISYFCPISTDPFGQRLSKTLSKSRVQLDWAPQTDLPTMLGFVSFDESSNQPRYSFYTKETAAASLDEEALESLDLAALDIVHFGSLSLAIEPLASTLTRLLERLPSRVTVFFDPNIRADLIEDEGLYRRRLQTFFNRAQVMKASDEDMHWLSPGCPPLEALLSFTSSSALTNQLIILTQGNLGSTGIVGDLKVALPAAQTSVVDTIGAGDTYQAGVLAWVYQNFLQRNRSFDAMTESDLSALMLYATTAAGINCSRRGCDPPWKRDFK